MLSSWNKAINIIGLCSKLANKTSEQLYEWEDYAEDPVFGN